MKTIAGILILSFSLLLKGEITSTIETREDGMWLVFSNTPPRWVLEQTGDLYTWHHVLTGSTTNSIIEFRIKSGMEAIFFRIRPE